jgi:hypothetical protein
VFAPSVVALFFCSLFYARNPKMREAIAEAVLDIFVQIFVMP